MTIDEKCINKEFNSKFDYSYQMYKCNAGCHCDYKFEEHNAKGQPTGVNYCIERYFIKESDEK